MKIVNKSELEVAALPFIGPDDKYILTVVVKGTFRISADMSVSLAEEQIPIGYGDEFFEEAKGVVKFESDVAPFKPRADIALIGKAHTPQHKPMTTLDVSLQVGTVKKTIRVFGSRKWSCAGRMSPATFSGPKPFQAIDLIYTRAYGGIDKEGGAFNKYNPVGRGYFVKKRKKSMNGALLPNLENPKHLIKSWKDQPIPAGFGFWSRSWQPRLKYMGTYDEAWQEERCPLPPTDFKFKYHNAAHPDLQVKGYLRGDEEVELLQMSPDGPLQFRLPGISPSCQAKTIPDPEAEEAPDIDVTLNLDTLCLLPEEKLFYQVWRGTIPIADITAQEIGDVVLDIV